MRQVIKLFIFITILFGICKAGSGNISEKILKIQQFEKECKDEHSGEILDPKKPTICILNHQDVQSAPDDPTEITIMVNNVNVNEIDIKSNQLTISMEINITWSEERLLLATPKYKLIKIKDNDLDRIWSPQFALRISDISTMTKVGISKDYKNSTFASNIFNLEAVRKCQMDFQFFPFDKQECIFGVSSNVL